MHALASGAKTEPQNRIAIVHATNGSSRGASVKKNEKKRERDSKIREGQFIAIRNESARRSEKYRHKGR